MAADVIFVQQSSPQLFQIGGTVVVPPDSTKKADVVLMLGQSLTLGRAPQVSTSMPPNFMMFRGGSEAAGFNAPAAVNYLAYGAPAANMSSLVPFVQPAGVETLGPGIAYQSAKAGVDACFYFSAGYGGASARMLHLAPLSTLCAGIRKAVSWVEAMGYAPVLRIIWDQGHGDADALDDGGNPGYTPTTTAQYLIACSKIFNRIRAAAARALGQPSWNEPIWVVPLLTQNQVASLAARRDIANAQVQMPTAIGGVQLLPPRSQFANLFDVDLVHPVGQGYRYSGELFGAFIHSALTVPRMIAKAVSGATVHVTFDQQVRLSATTPDMMVPGNSKDGFTIIDNSGAEVAVTAVAVAGNTVTLTPASTVNLTGSWYVRNGLQFTGMLGVSGDPASYMPRTLIVGVTDVGAAEDGTVIENFSTVQEL